MKYTLLTTLFLFSFLLFACGGDSGDSGACSDSSLLGSWVHVLDDDAKLNFKSNCTGNETSCNATFKYPNVSGSSGSVLINVTSTNGGDHCLPLGQHECTFEIEGDAMGFDCGNGVGIYTKK
jgi:hypothetical protein